MNATSAEPIDTLDALRALGVSPAQLARASAVDAAELEVFLRWYAQAHAIEE